MELLSLVLTLLVFSSLGFYLPSGFKLPLTLLTLISLGGGIVVVSSIGVGTKLVSIMGVSIFLNHSLVGLLLGVSMRIILRYWKFKKVN